MYTDRHVNYGCDGVLHALLHPFPIHVWHRVPGVGHVDCGRPLKLAVRAPQPEAENC